MNPVVSATPTILLLLLTAIAVTPPFDFPKVPPKK